MPSNFVFIGIDKKLMPNSDNRLFHSNFHTLTLLHRSANNIIILSINI